MLLQVVFHVPGRIIIFSIAWVKYFEQDVRCLCWPIRYYTATYPSDTPWFSASFEFYKDSIFTSIYTAFEGIITDPTSCSWLQLNN